MPPLFLLFLLLGTQHVPLWLQKVQAEAQENSHTLQWPMREVLLPHLFVVEVLNREVGQQPPVCELVALEVDESDFVVMVDAVVAPILLPGLGLEGHREGASHLYGLADWQVRSGFVIEEAQDLVVEVYRGAGEFDRVHLIVLFHGNCINFLDQGLSLLLICINEI